jgi:hypothetical protein
VNAANDAHASSVGNGRGMKNDVFSNELMISKWLLKLAQKSAVKEKVLVDELCCLELIFVNFGTCQVYVMSCVGHAVVISKI